MKTKTSSTAHQTDESRPCTQRQDEKAVAIIIALVVVGTLAVIGTTFSIGMNLEQRAAVNLRDAERARFASIAGVERAIAGMRIYSASRIFVNDMTDAWGYRGTSRPSFYGDTFDGEPIEIGPGRWYNRIQNISTTAPFAAYRLRVLDTQGQINLNMKGAGFRTLLNNLCRILRDTVPGFTVADDAIYIHRRDRLPGQVFISKEQLREVPGMTEANYNIIKDFVTVHSWKDENVLEYGISPLTRIDPGRGRSPININTAGLPVLYAILSELTNGIPGVPGAFRITSAEAQRIANAIITRRNTTPFRTWNEFRNFIVGLRNTYTDPDHSVSNQWDFNLILVNSNPNTAILDTNPNRGWREFIDPGATGIDKRDLTVFTTEVCFNTGGYYEIQSIGYALDAAGNVVARNYVSSIVNVANKIRHSAQAQFAASGSISAATNTIHHPEPQITALQQACTWDGQVRLQDMEWTSEPGIRLFANFNDGLNADDGGGNLQAGGYLEQTTVNPLPSRDGDLLPDGVFISTPGEYLTYSRANNFPTDRADFVTLEFWVKMNVAPITGTHYFFYLRNSPPPTEYVYIRNREGNLELAVRGDALRVVSATFPIAGWNIGEWHHIAAQIDWENGELSPPRTTLELFVNGMTTGMRKAAALYLLDVPDDDNNDDNNDNNDDDNDDDNWDNMFIGANPDATNNDNDDNDDDNDDDDDARNANATIDSIRISNIQRYTSNVNFTPPPRYQASGTYRSATTFSKRFPIGTGFIWPVRWGTITWTGHEPLGGDISMQHRREYPPGVVGSWSPWTPISPSPTDIVINTTSHYIQYRATLTAPTDRRDTPTLDDVTIVYLPRVRIVYWKEVDRLMH